MVKNAPANAGDMRDASSVPGSGRSCAGVGAGGVRLGVAVYSGILEQRQRSLEGYSP